MTFLKSYSMLSIFLLTMLVASSFALDMSIISSNERNPNLEPSRPRSDEEVMSIFEGWLVKHNKVYNALGEKQKRFNIFKDNLMFIDQHNSKNETYQVGLNQFADLTLQEFTSRYLSTHYEPLNTSVSYTPRGNPKSLSDSVDWREKGAVTPIKDQGDCGSCWIFAPVAAVESLNYIVNKKLVSLSEQEVLDCNKYVRNCNGGDPAYTYLFIISNGGVTTQENYPYRARTGSCDESKKADKVVSIDNYRRISNDEKALQEQVARQPVSAAIAASSSGIQFYKKGVYTGTCGNHLDHAITIVGYGKEEILDYWIIKNSWGHGWGEKGYLRLQRNVDMHGGKCGITKYIQYPFIYQDLHVLK